MTLALMRTMLQLCTTCMLSLAGSDMCTHINSKYVQCVSGTSRRAHLVQISRLHLIATDLQTCAGCPSGAPFWHRTCSTGHEISRKLSLGLTTC